MKKILTFLILCLSQSILFSQETIEIIVKNKKEDSKEIYTVLASDQQTKHGVYQQYINNKLRIKCNYLNGLKNGLFIDYNYNKTINFQGFYKLDKKDSTWIEYNYTGNISTKINYKDGILEGEWLEYFDNGKDLKIEGYYINGLKSALWTEFFPNNQGFYTQGKYTEGLKDKIWIENYQNSTFQRSKKEYDKSKKVGIWEFNNPQGELIKKFDYDSKILLFYKNSDAHLEKENSSLSVKESSTEIDIPNDSTIYQEVDILGEYIPNTEYYSIDLMRNFKYPEVAIEEGLQGRCYLRFIITKNGQMADLKVVKGVTGCPECDKEALRVLNLLEDNWIPALKNGKAVNSYYYAPITFKLF